MQIDVGRYIADLLYRHNTVTIPGFGGFTAEYKSAVVDQVQGKVNPPSKKITFNKNLAANDGRLSDYIQQKHNITSYEAQKAVEDYVRQIKAALERQEIIVIPKVGRIYKDYAKQLQFLPENTNFNLNAYGLPSVEFSPISRPREVFKEPVPTAAINDPTVPTTEEIVNEKLADWLQRNLILVVSVAAIVIALGVFMTIYNQESSPFTADEPTVPASRYNSKPTRDEGVDSDIVTPLEEEEGIVSEESAAEEDSEIEASTPLPDQKSCIIVIGMFGNDENVKKLVERIYTAGFEPFQEKNGRLTRVGVQFMYDQESEIKDKLRIVREKFHPDAIIYKK